MIGVQRTTPDTCYVIIEIFDILDAATCQCIKETAFWTPLGKYISKTLLGWTLDLVIIARIVPAVPISNAKCAVICIDCDGTFKAAESNIIKIKTGALPRMIGRRMQCHIVTIVLVTRLLANVQVEIAI